MFGFLRSSNGAQTISGEAALEWKNVRKWVVQDIFEAVGPPWFSADLTGFARANAGCEQNRSICPEIWALLAFLTVL